MSQETSNYQFYLNDPRLRMSIAGRSLVRVVSGVGYLVLVVAAITFLLSYDIHSLFYLGLFLTLVIIDLLAHKGEGDTPISELPKEGRINLAAVIAPSAFLVIERAMDASIITHKSFLLELTSKLFEIPEIENGLSRLDITPAEFRQKLGVLMLESAKSAGDKKEDYVHQSQLLATYAFDEAVNAGHKFIQVSDLFSALLKMNDESLDRLFTLFSIEPSDLRGALIFSWLSTRLSWFAPKRRRIIYHRVVVLESMPAGVNAITEVEAEKILIYKSFLIKKNARIIISFGAIKRAVALGRKYFSDQPLLSSSEELLRDALADAELRGEKVVTADRVTAVAQEKR